MNRIINAEGATLGRLCTSVAKGLLQGDNIIIVNSEKAVISGRKKMIKGEYRQKREVGTYRKGPFFHRTPDRIVKRTVRGMIPYQTPKGRAAFKRLKCYIGIPDEFQKKDMEVIDASKKNHVAYLTIEEISKSLGANF